MRFERNNLIWIIVLVLGGLVVFQFLNTPKIPEGRWECAQVACSRLMAEREIAAKVCSSNDKGEMICSITADNKNLIVPLSQLNFSALSICAEYSCTKDVFVRDAKYSINTTTG